MTQSDPSEPLRILIASPNRPGANSGNGVTAHRWQRRLVELGHEVTIDEFGQGEGLATSSTFDLIVALHARRTAEVVETAKQTAPTRPVVVALTGTDLYRDLPEDADARRSVDLADACIVLQSAATELLDQYVPGARSKTHVLYQSVEGDLPPATPPSDQLIVAVVAHLRDVKDPLLAARAVRLLPASSVVRVVHAGQALTAAWEATALAEAAANPRYEWVGPLNRPQALELMAQSSVVANTSLMEGGANVVTEAIAIGVPVIGTDIDGLTGLLGKDHPGLVPVGDAAAMAALLVELESNPNALEELRRRSLDRQHLTSGERERDAWAKVLASL